MLDVTHFSAIAALTASAVGGLTSLGTSWLALRAHALTEHRFQDRSRRQKLYKAFIEEASRLYGDAISRDQPDIANLVGISAKISRMRILSSGPVVDAAERVARTIAETSLGPNRTVAELRGMMKGDMDPLKDFSEACRQELQSHVYLGPGLQSRSPEHPGVRF